MFTAQTPTQHLALCMAVIRGAVCVCVEDVNRDVEQWIREHGRPTKENVEAWAERSELLRRAIEEMIGQPVSE